MDWYQNRTLGNTMTGVTSLEALLFLCFIVLSFLDIEKSTRTIHCSVSGPRPGLLGPLMREASASSMVRDLVTVNDGNVLQHHFKCLFNLTEL